MKVFGYARISRDEDDKRDSIENQQHIIQTYCDENNLKVEKIFTDNNYSGYIFDRPDFNKLKELIEKNEIDVLIVKDLSRIGRHNALTLLFLEKLKENGVNLISISDNINFTEGKDDMIVGVKTWFNELYVKDISRKVKESLKQKQKEGLVLVPHFGYMKNPNNKQEILIDDEAANTVRKIFELYIQGYGFKQVALKLTKKGYTTPAVHKANNFGVNGRPTDTKRHLWHSGTIARIIKNDAYIGVHRCGVTESRTIKGKRTFTDESKHIVHEDFFPKIIDEKTFELAQEILNNRIKNKQRAKHGKITLYSGLLRCADCGETLVSRKNKGSDSKARYYVCGTYHRYGNEHCSRHTVYEHELTEVILSEINQLREKAELNLEQVDKAIKELSSKKKNYEKTIENIVVQIEEKKNEIKNYSRQLAKGLIDEELFSELTKESKQHLKILNGQLQSVEEIKSIDKDLKKNALTSKDILNEIITRGTLENKDIDMLVNEIIVSETDIVGKWGRKKVDLYIDLKAPFVYHEDTPTWENVTLWLINFKNMKLHV